MFVINLNDAFDAMMFERQVSPKLAAACGQTYRMNGSTIVCDDASTYAKVLEELRAGRFDYTVSSLLNLPRASSTLAVERCPILAPPPTLASVAVDDDPLGFGIPIPIAPPRLPKAHGQAYNDAMIIAKATAAEVCNKVQTANTLDPSRSSTFEAIVDKNRAATMQCFPYPSHNYMLLQGEKTLTSGWGRCDDVAAAVYFGLVKRRIKSRVEIFGTNPPSHAYVVVGRLNNSDPANPRTWGEAFVVDCWDRNSENGIYAEPAEGMPAVLLVESMGGFGKSLVPICAYQP